MAHFEFKWGNGVVRFVHFFNYPQEISPEASEKWYFEQHVPEVKKLPGIIRYRTWRGLPSIKWYTYDPWDRFVRMSEIAFENLELCLSATMLNPAPWSDRGFREFECAILDEEPQYDLLRDVPVQQYKYASLLPKFAGGEPEYDISDDTFMDIYMFNYKVPLVDGEDWYLGHHTREGRHSKQLGNRHYQTWKILRVQEGKNSLLKPNRFYRLTELGLPEFLRSGWPPGTPRPRSYMTFTQSPLGEVIGEWRNILIDPARAQDLLK
jgi:hypothetical protein